MTSPLREVALEQTPQIGATEHARGFYVQALCELSHSPIPFLVGGAFAFSQLVHIERDTKDLDLFLRPEDVPRALEIFRGLGYRTLLPFPHWLGKIYRGNDFIDLIFSSGNGIARVDNGWFEHAVEQEVLGIPLLLCPPEEMIWSKAFVQERDRFDGADVIHLIRQFGPSLDWNRLLMRFESHWRVLFSHIVMFGFVYPNQRHRVPEWVAHELAQRFAAEGSDSKNLVCNGTLLSREQYMHDITHIGYRDGRLAPPGPMAQADIDIWTAAIGEKK